MPEKKSFRRRHRKPCKVHSRNIGLIVKDENGLEPKFIPVIVRQHYRRQASLVAIRHTMEEDRDSIPALDTVVHRIDLGIRNGREEIPFYLTIAQQVEQDILQIIIGCSTRVEPRKQGKFVDSCQRLPKGKQSRQQMFGRRIQDECTIVSVSAQPCLSHDALKQHSLRTVQT